MFAVVWQSDIGGAFPDHACSIARALLPLESGRLHSIKGNRHRSDFKRSQVRFFARDSASSLFGRTSSSGL